MNASKPIRLRAMLGLLLICSAAWSSKLIAEDDRGLRLTTLAQAQSAVSQAEKEQQNPIGSERAEKNVLEFVGLHQPKMLGLLEFLKRHQPAQYSQALKEMARTQIRLEGFAKRDQEMYEVELKLWQIRSDLRLLAAEMSAKAMSTDEHRVRQLTELIASEASQEVVRLKLLKLRAEREVQKLTEQIEGLTAANDEYVARNVKLWQSRIVKQSRNK